MFKFETRNELYLEVTNDENRVIFTKMGAWVGDVVPGPKFDKVLLGPQGNPLQALAQQIARRITGENVPLTKVIPQGPYVSLFADMSQHVVAMELAPGEVLSVESESLLAFSDSCKYGVRFLGAGVMSQKGFMTSTLEGMGPGAWVAFLTDGNPIVLNTHDPQYGDKPVRCDPDAMVCFISKGHVSPKVNLNIGLKNLIGQASGESYLFEFNSPDTQVVIQPTERKSGINIGMDGGNSGKRATTQQNQTFGQAAQGVQQTLGGLGQQMGQMGQGAGQVGSGLGNMLGGLFK